MDFVQEAMLVFKLAADWAKGLIENNELDWRQGMLKTLARETDRHEIANRIGCLTPTSERRWGSMHVGAMICHLSDAYLIGLRERSVEPVKMPLPGRVIKFMSLRLPMQWPRGLVTPEEVRQGGLGTAPLSFAEDRSRLLTIFNRFCRSGELSLAKHPFFGRMSHSDWMRWGYLHSDHHLRQFGV